ncbi:MAG: polysaccharide pyruvyl transferase family protein [Colwellia sp.]|nr:polysaccharide pyruvyl transferase family protein [Colwellia sp.]
MRVLYYGGCWQTNIGNAFLDYGSLYAINEAAPEAEVFFASELSRWFYMVNGYNMEPAVDLARFADIDYVVISGMVLYDDFLRLEAPVIKELSDRGVKIVLSGCAGDNLGEQEVGNLKRFIETINVVGFISRDADCYDIYKDCFPKSMNGLDWAFFLKDAFKPMPLTLKDFIVFSFRHIDEPEIDTEGKRIIRADHECYNFFKSPLRGVVFSKRWPFIKMSDYEPVNKKALTNNSLISNLPDDYLNLYANAYATYSDRIHASIATLSFGNYARLYSTSQIGKRIALLERVEVPDITKKLVKLDQQKISVIKQEQIDFLRSILV